MGAIEKTVARINSKGDGVTGSRLRSSRNQKPTTRREPIDLGDQTDRLSDIIVRLESLQSEESTLKTDIENLKQILKAQKLFSAQLHHRIQLQYDGFAQEAFEEKKRNAKRWFFTGVTTSLSATGILYLAKLLLQSLR